MNDRALGDAMKDLHGYNPTEGKERALNGPARWVHADGRRCVKDPQGNWQHWDFDGRVIGPKEPTPETLCDRTHTITEETAEEPDDDRGEFGMPGIGSAGEMLLGSSVQVESNGVEWTIGPGRLSADFGKQGYTVEPQTAMARRIMSKHLPEALEHFLGRNAEYGEDNDFNLGTAGQYVDISRKVQKLKRRWWNGRVEREMGEESDKVIVMELIGHLLMAMDMLDQGPEDGDGAQGTLRG